MTRSAIMVSVILPVLGWTGYQHENLNVATYVAKSAVAPSETVDESAHQASKDLKRVRILSEMLEPRLKGESDPLRISLLLRNLIVREVKYVDDPGVVHSRDYDWSRLADAYQRSLLHPLAAHMCGGRALTYLIALRAFGNVARKVGLYQAVEGTADIAVSHASVEVLIDGKWIAQDPYFNLSLRDDTGRMIGWIEAAEILEHGGRITHSTDGFDVPERRRIETWARDNRVTLESFTAFINTSSYWDGSATIAPTVRPASWDGVIKYQNGLRFDVVVGDSTDIFKLLAAPLN